MLQITDPIHGYIELKGIFADIVNTPEFQRLRSVEQGSFRPVYPGARHDRFAHSLGTYHLATKFVEPFFYNLEKDAGIRLSAEQKKKLTKTFLYAALLHDIGHAPFSHTTEDFFAEKKGARESSQNGHALPQNGQELPRIWYDLCDAVGQVNSEEGELFSAQTEKHGASHEIMSATILVSKWEKLTGKTEQEVDLPLAARMVIGFTYSPEDLSTMKGQNVISLGVRNCLIQMINYSLLDVDRLDYMGRDARMSGFANATLDLDCLAQSATAVCQSDAWVLWKGKGRHVLKGDTTLVVEKNIDAALRKDQRLMLPVGTKLVTKKGEPALVEEGDAYFLQEDVPGPMLGENSRIVMTKTGMVALPAEIQIVLPKGTEVKHSKDKKTVWMLSEDLDMTMAAGAFMRPGDVVDVKLDADGVELMPDGTEKAFPVQDDLQLRPSWLVPAYREAALRVFDLMFQAKLSHDAWVLAAPAAAYDAALLAHCIRQLDEKIKDPADKDKKYMETIFSVEALSQDGVSFAGKHYRLLSDVDVAADLKAQTDPVFQELYTRELGKRRIAAWRSYYEYHHLFNYPEMGLTPEGVYGFFKPLLKYLDKKKIFTFDETAYNDVKKSKDAEAIRAAELLKKFLKSISKKEKYSVVLLDRISNFTMKLDPAQIRIVFSTRKDGAPRLPMRGGKYNYSTYADMTGITDADKRSKPYFYIMKKHGLRHNHLQTLREMLAAELNN